MRQILTHFGLIFVSVYLSLGTGMIAIGGGWQELLKLAINTLYVYGGILLFVRLKFAFWLVFFPFLLFFAFYAPVGLTNGEITSHFVLAIFGTYFGEAGEFVSDLPTAFIALSIFSIAFIAWFKTQSHSKLKKRNLIVCLLVFALASAFCKHLLIVTARSFYIASKSFQSSYSQLENFKNISIKSKWQVLNVAPKYKNYVVIIGESARKDYHEIYGYSVKNNPFLSSVNGTFVDGFHAVGLNTIPSLNATLNHNADINLNIINLAKDAGFETFWLSNQGYLGEFDTPITMIAKRAKNVFFLKKELQKEYDSDLLTPFSEIFAKKSEKNRLIFLHLYGSHPQVCHRLTSKEYKNYTHKETFEINCYVQRA